MSAPTSVKELLDIGERVLVDSTHLFEDHDSRGDAAQLLAACMHVSTEELSDLDEPPARTRERYLSMIARRAAGEPLPFLTGHIEFYGLDLVVRPGPFVPRPSSELVVGEAAARLRRRKKPVIVDVCTGAGPIAIAIADEFPDAEVWGCDIDASGLRQGRANMRRLGVDNVNFVRGDMYDPLPRRLHGSVDLITGHVPYVPAAEVADLPSEVREHEPIYTLSDSSDDGLSLMHRAVFEATQWLKRGGWLLLEVSDDFAPKVQRLCRRAGFAPSKVASDDDDLSVVVEAQWSPTRA